MTLKQKLFSVTVFTKLSTKRFFRDRLAIFFTVIFPLIFLFVFGGIFGKPQTVSFKVAVLNESQSEYSQTYIKQLKESKLFKIEESVTTLDKAKEKMGRGELDATLQLPPGFGSVTNGKYPSGEVKVIFTQNNEQAAQTLTQVLNAQTQAINRQFVQTDTPFTVTSEQLNEKSLSRFDYTFAGLLGFSIIGLGIFGPINYFPELKKQGILRRLHTTPIRVWQYFSATAATNTIVGLITMAVLFVVAILVFDLKVVGNYFELAIFIALGIVTILGIGLAIGGWSKNERQAAPLGNIITFPMIFLSGTFFPRYVMPEWLQHVSSFLPLTPIIDGIRLIATEGKHLTEIGPQLGLIAIWFIIIYIIAFRVFRWE